MYPKHLRYLFIALIVTPLFFACKKDNVNPPGSGNSDYYVKFSLDGTQMSFLLIAEGNMNVVDASGKNTFTGGGLKSTASTSSNIAAMIVSSVPQIRTGITYVNYATSTAGFERAAYSTVSFTDPSGVTFVSWGDENKSFGVISDTKIAFSEITTTNLRGTFSGTIYKSLSGTSEKHIMAAGEFNLKRR